ncbi:MAG TPA: hypothetical protein VHB79_29150 [Polyangiaceae bacterium]|nr:hypothetical protein [Polyangiaceae bacterium]
MTPLHCTPAPMVPGAIRTHILAMSKAAVVLVFLRDSLNEWAHDHSLDHYAKLAALRWSALRKNHL